MNETEAQHLTDQLAAGTISGTDQKRLVAFTREQWRIPGLTDDEVCHILITGHESYGEPDENGEVREL